MLTTVVLFISLSIFVLLFCVYILFKIRKDKREFSNQVRKEIHETSHLVPKDLKVHKLHVETSVEPKHNFMKKEIDTESIKSDETKKQFEKFKVVEGLKKETRIDSDKDSNVVMPKMKYEVYKFSTAPNSFDEIKWR